ncbi:MAG: hypothetical protein LBE06_03675 [Azoarcus sp.]|jgi:hypothetical protein|nr:hypothetical protein [Azoarcus sp.]
MQDITDKMLLFKEAVRHAWNTYFVQCDSPMSPQIQMAFEEVERGLLRGIVLAAVGLSERASEYRQRPLPWLVVEPIKETRELPLQLGKVDDEGNTRWGMPIALSITGRTVFEFFDFFDWYPYGMVDLPYIRARVFDLPSKPDSRGSIVLIEQRYCRFLVDVEQ